MLRLLEVRSFDLQQRQALRFKHLKCDVWTTRAVGVQEGRGVGCCCCDSGVARGRALRGESNGERCEHVVDARRVE